jgi:hypothetical protein
MGDVPLRNDADPQWQQLHAAADEQEASAARVVYAALAAILTARVLRAVRSHLRVGDVENALREIPTDQLLTLATALEPILTATAVRGAVVAARGPAVITTAELLVRLGRIDPFVAAGLREWATTQAAQLVRGVTDETRQAIRRIVTDAVARGTVPRDTAKLIQAVVGLTEPQARAVARYRAALVAEGVLPFRVDRLTERYGARLLRHRARVIARHETMLAANEGRRAVWERERREGVIDPNRWEREWVAIVPSDGRTCRFCVGMDGQRAPINGSYPNGSSGPPGHVICRCTEKLVRMDAA